MTSKTHFLYFIPLFIGLGLALLLGIYLFRPPSPTKENSMEGKPFPEFSMASLINDKTTVDSSRIKNKKTIINLFASWCMPCKVEHPLLVELAKKHHIPVYGISWNDTKEAARMYLTKEGNPYEDVGLDSSGRLAIALGATGIPETYLVDEKGIIVFHVRGPLSTRDVRKGILPKFK